MPKTYYTYKAELDTLLAERKALRIRLQAIAKRVNAVRVSMHRTVNKIPTNPFEGLDLPAPAPAQTEPEPITRQIDDLSDAEFKKIFGNI